MYTLHKNMVLCTSVTGFDPMCHRVKEKHLKGSDKRVMTWGVLSGSSGIGVYCCCSACNVEVPSEDSFLSVVSKHGAIIIKRTKWI